MLSAKTTPNGEYSNLVFSSTLGLCPKSSPVKYSYFSKRSLEDKADILAASLPKLHWALFALILSSRILSSSVNVSVIKIQTNLFKIFKDYSQVALYLL